MCGSSVRGSEDRRKGERGKKRGGREAAARRPGHVDTSTHRHLHRMNRWRDWLDQARENLAHAERSAEMGDFSWACFSAHQAAEAALKAVHLRAGQVAWGHSLVDLIGALPENLDEREGLMDAAKVLDRYYIPTRYPDAHPSGSAARHYTKTDAGSAVDSAREIIEFCAGARLED